jgi:uncharacterized protein YndB with AHSA1/START domain
MSLKKLIAKVEIDIVAPIEKVWEALTNPAIIQEYMFGTRVNSNWKAGSSITWSGEWEGKPYHDEGKILSLDPPRHLQYTHITSNDAELAKFENTHLIDINLLRLGNKTHIILEQDNNKNEEDRSSSEKNWDMMLRGMKSLLEKKH